MTTIFIVVGSVLALLLVFIFGYSVGHSTTDDDIIKIAEKLKHPKYFCNCGCGGDWCSKTHCFQDLSCWKYNQPQTTREAMMYEDGMQSGYKRGKDEGYKTGVYEARRHPEEKIMKLADAMKPLEQFKKELYGETN
jgi:hypothetical protein